MNILHSFCDHTGLTHLCPPLRSTFAVRETASLGIMGEPRVPPLNPSTHKWVEFPEISAISIQKKNFSRFARS